MRVLVDRIWPRGIKKNELAMDLWLKEIAPSTELRKWFGHDPAKWPAFKRRYGAELEERPQLTTLLRLKARAFSGRTVGVIRCTGHISLPGGGEEPSVKV